VVRIHVSQPNDFKRESPIRDSLLFFLAKEWLKWRHEILVRDIDPALNQNLLAQPLAGDFAVGR
jgi:hypothetical protein